MLPGGMVSEGDAGRSGLLSQIIGYDLHLVAPDDSNTGVGGSQVDAYSTSVLHLELNQIGGLEMEILKYRMEQSDYQSITIFSLQFPDRS